MLSFVVSNKFAQQLDQGKEKRERVRIVRKLIKRISFKNVLIFIINFSFIFSLFNKYLHNVHQFFASFSFFFVFTLNLFDFSISFLCLRLSFIVKYTSSSSSSSTLELFVCYFLRIFHFHFHNVLSSSRFISCFPSIGRLALEVLTELF